MFFEILKLSRGGGFEISSNLVEEVETSRRENDPDILQEEVVSDRTVEREKMIAGEKLIDEDEDGMSNEEEVARERDEHNDQGAWRRKPTKTRRRNP